MAQDLMTFQVDPGQREALDKIASQENKTVSMILRELIRNAEALAGCAAATPLHLTNFVAQMCAHGMIRAMRRDQFRPVDPDQLTMLTLEQAPGFYLDFCRAKAFEFAKQSGQPIDADKKTKAKLAVHIVDGEFKGYRLDASSAYGGLPPDAARLEKIAKIRNYEIPEEFKHLIDENGKPKKKV